MQDYRKLDVWTKSHDLALDVYRITATRRSDADAGAGVCAHAGSVGREDAAADADVRAAVRRAALCVPVRIVVGCEAETAPEFALAMHDAATSVDELAYQLRFARDAGVVDAVPYARLEARANQLRAMLGALHRTVRLKLGVAARPEAVAARAVRAVRDDGSSRRGSRPRSTS